MKKRIITTIVLAIIFSSCSQSSPSRKSTNNLYKNKIVLGAFRDMVSSSTLDESKLQDLPKLVNLIEEMTPARNQSDRGTCTHFSTIGLVEGTIKKDLGIEVNLSEEYLNYKSKSLGRFQTTEGSTVEANISAINRGGLILEDDWSYQPAWFKKIHPCVDYESSNSSAPKICFSHNAPNKNALDRKIDSKNIKFFFREKNTNEIIRFLATEKRPLVMSVTVNFNGWSNFGETTYDEKLRQECITSPEDCGGHSIVLTGYDMEKRKFMFKNSWGKDWGIDGFGTIPFDVVDKYVSEVLYYAKVVGDVKFPESKKSTLNVVKFDLSTSLNEDNSIKIDIDGNIEETSGKMIYLSSYLVKKSKVLSNELPTNKNTDLVLAADSDERKLIKDTHIRVTNYIIPQEENNYIIKPTDNSGLFFSNTMLSLPSVELLMSSNEFDLALRTTIYVHDDNEGFVTLKRKYTPLN